MQALKYPQARHSTTDTEKASYRLQPSVTVNFGGICEWFERDNKSPTVLQLKTQSGMTGYNVMDELEQGFSNMKRKPNYVHQPTNSPTVTIKPWFYRSFNLKLNYLKYAESDGDKEAQKTEKILISSCSWLDCISIIIVPVHLGQQQITTV